VAGGRGHLSLTLSNGGGGGESYVFVPPGFLYIYIFIFIHLQRENSALSIKKEKGERQTRRKRRVTRMVAIVVLLFGICWFPIHVIAVWIQFDPHFPKTDGMHHFKLFAHTLSYANSCLNPFVYAFVNDGFRKALLKRSPDLSQLCSCLFKSSLTQELETSMIDKAVEAKPGMDIQFECSTATQTTACTF
jgi:hypothetical protein